MYAQRVDHVAVPKPPLQAPQSLRVPFELSITSLKVNELHATALGEQPLRDLRATLHLGADAGASHRVEALSLAWGRLRASGSAHIATQAPMALEANVALNQDATDTLAAWASQARLSGPLLAPALTATLRTQPGAEREKQPQLDPAPSCPRARPPRKFQRARLTRRRPRARSRWTYAPR